MDETPKLSYLDWLTDPLLDRLSASLNINSPTEPEKNEEGNKVGNVLQALSGVNFDEKAAWRNGPLLKAFDKQGLGLSDKGAAGVGIAGQAISAATLITDEVFMGDNNFSAQSEMIDEAVHGVSGALMKSGNPYAMAGAAALEVANFATKALGDTVLGFDVDIDSSGYSSNMGHMNSKSYRNFGALIGMPFLNNKSMAKKLQKRNEKARMALAAADIAEELKYEQTARANSIQNTMLANLIALAGGTDLSLLAN